MVFLLSYLCIFHINHNDKFERNNSIKSQSFRHMWLTHSIVPIPYGEQVHFKGGTTLRNLLVSTKYSDRVTKKSSVIYWFRCGKIDCEDEYIGESSRTFGERYKECLKAPSPIFEHQSNTGHTTSVENFRIIGGRDTIWLEPSKKPYI